MKLNVGCGTDYREGFVNIDGSTSLARVDRVVDISRERLTAHFEAGSCEYIIANDIVEHHYHWEAVQLLADFFALLRSGGGLEIRVPDAEFIIESRKFGVEEKLVMLFGGQDVPQGRDAEMDESRRRFPQYFCHKYGWTRARLGAELTTLGFRDVTFRQQGTNFVALAAK